MLIDRANVEKYFPLQVVDATNNGVNDQSYNQLSSLYSDFSPCKVMKQFNDEFFDGKLVPRDNGAVLEKFCADNTQVVNVEELKTMLGIHVF